MTSIDDAAPVGTVLRGMIGTPDFSLGWHVMAVRVAGGYDKAADRHIPGPGWQTVWSSDGSGRYHASGEDLRLAHVQFDWFEVYRPARKAKRSLSRRLLAAVVSDRTQPEA